jgi:iron only hydrogenase large subunit-like protein
MENKIQGKLGLPWLPSLFAEVSDSQLIMHVVININAGYNMWGEPCSASGQQENNSLLSSCCPPFLMYTHTCPTHHSNFTVFFFFSTFLGL